MALDQGLLEDSLRPLFQPETMPTSDPVGDWSRAYVKYAQSAVAGAVVMTAPLVPSPDPGGTFYDALDAAFRSMWTATVWAGPGATGVVATVPPLQPFLSALAPSLILSPDRDLALSSIAVALHTYTLSIVVTVTPASGTPVPTLLS